MTSVLPAERLLTAEEYGQLPSTNTPTELVRGKVVEMNVPAPRHGEICVNLIRYLGPHIWANSLGRLISNDGGVITEHDPDTVRGPDVSFYSHARIPQGPLPRGYLAVVPELVFEVRSPTDRWSRLLAKAGEYLEAGVTVVCLLDQVSETVQVYRVDELPQTLQGDDALHLPDVLGELRVPVRQFFG